jgi:hypothetical protein
MTATCMPRPRFRTEHLVRFVGGEGTIRGTKWEFGRWMYLVKLGIEPEFGRIGPEAMILLDETELYET